MSIVKIQAPITGTGTVTITAPTTNSDRTVTLPDETGTIILTGGALGTPSSGNASNLTNLNASNLSTGTVPDARFPATLPAASGVNLTALNASNLGSGTVPTARLASGTANSTTYLRGDSTWQTISTTPTTAQVLSATAGAAVGDVGTYAFMVNNASGIITEGSTVAGSNLRYNGASFENASSATYAAQFGGTPSGTWRAMGRGGNANFTSQYAITLFLRIS